MTECTWESRYIGSRLSRLTFESSWSRRSRETLEKENNLYFEKEIHNVKCNNSFETMKSIDLCIDNIFGKNVFSNFLYNLFALILCIQSSVNHVNKLHAIT